MIVGNFGSRLSVRPVRRPSDVDATRQDGITMVQVEFPPSVLGDVSMSSDARADQVHDQVSSWTVNAGADFTLTAI